MKAGRPTGRRVTAKHLASHGDSDYLCKNMDSHDITVGAFARQLEQSLSPRYGTGEARAMVRLMFHALKGWDLTAITINSDRPVSSWLREKAEEVVGRLLKGEPLQYILGEARFYGMDLKVSPDVLIPRHETEELVDIIVDENKDPDLRVLDVGTGSGAIAIALSRNLPFSHVTALDISQRALDVAESNAARLHADVTFVHADIFSHSPADGSFDIIVSNPPYIAESERKDMDSNVLDYEPASALFVPDSDPLIYYSRISTIGEKALRSGGRLYFEINPLFADKLRSLLVADGYSDVRIIQDISRRSRFAAAVKP